MLINIDRLSSLTTTDFKSLFRRDFPFLNEWDVTTQYYAGDKVYYSVNNRFYQASMDTQGGDPQNSGDWKQVIDNALNYISDDDINAAYDAASTLINPGILNPDELLKRAFLYLAAHSLVIIIRTAKSGINSQGDFTISQKSAGSVSASYAIPDAYAKDPNLNFYTKSSYGVQYLAIVLPRTRGNIASIAGGSQP